MICIKYRFVSPYGSFTKNIQNTSSVAQYVSSQTYTQACLRPVMGHAR